MIHAGSLEILYSGLTRFIGKFGAWAFSIGGIIFLYLFSRSNTDIKKNFSALSQLIVCLHSPREIY